MTHPRNEDRDNQGVASLTIGSDLRIAQCNAAWREAGLPGASGAAKERIDELFPGTDVVAHVLNVLACGQPREMVVLPLETGKGRRYLCASFYPEPKGAKPPRVRRVLMQARVTNATLLLDGITGMVLEDGRGAGALSERNESDLRDGWRVEPSMSEEEFEAALATAERRSLRDWGCLQRRTPDGREVDLESILNFVDGYKC